MIFRFILTSLLVISSYFVFSQNLTKADSLKIEFNKKGIQAKQATKVALDIFTFYNRINPDSALIYLDLSKNLVQSTKNKNLKAKVFQAEANYLQNRGDFSGSMAASEQAINLFEQLHDTLGLAKAYSTLGLNYKINGGDSRNVKDFLRMGLNYEIKALSYYKIANEIDGQLRAYSNIGIIYRDLKELENARESYLNGIKLAKKHKIDSYSLGILKANLSQIYREVDKDYDGAIKLLHEAIINYQKNNVRNSQEHAYRNISYNYSSKGDYALAILYAQKAVDIAHEVKNVHRQINAYSALYTAQKGAGLYREAFENYDHVRDLEDSLFSIEKTSIIARMNSKFETLKKTDEIKILNKNAELQRFEIISLISSILLILVIGSFVFWYYNQKRKTEKLLLEEEVKTIGIKLEYKQKELTTKVLQLARKNEFLNKIDTEVENLKTNVDGSINKASTKISKLIKRDLSDEHQWEQFSAEFAVLHSSFLDSLILKYGNFSKSEIRLISLLKMNIASKDIADILNISNDGLKKARYRLRKKLMLDSDEDIQAFLISFR